MALVLGGAYESRPGVFHRDLRQHWKTCVEAVLVDHTKTFPVGIAATTTRTVFNLLTNQDTVVLRVTHGHTWHAHRCEAPVFLATQGILFRYRKRPR